MENYIPPFTISNKMLRLVSSISEKVGKIDSPRQTPKQKPEVCKEVLTTRHSAF